MKAVIEGTPTKSQNKSQTKHQNKEQFLTLRVTPDFRDALAVVAEQALRSVSSQALYYMRLGMEAEERLKAPTAS